MGTAPKDASEATRAKNAVVEDRFDPADFERASRGLIAQHATGAIETSHGVVFDVNRYAFVERGSANPDTVNPSLWRQAQLNGIHGLFEVAPGVWQARGYDISNVTFIAGETGWIVIDPLTVEPCARACLDLANEHLGARPVVAVIYTHSHTDHFGGVLGVTTQADVDAGRCRIIAPEHFLRETIGENVVAGYAMVRRAMYQFGPLLPPGPKGHVDCGLGKAIPIWPPGLIAPSEDITATGTELVVDGVRIVFQLTPETEAPSEMNFFFPDHGWLCTAENCTHTMHNLVPIRGALVRDSLKWSKYIAEMIELFGKDTELMFASHNWPRWGNDNVLAYLALQRDLYRWMHDQTMRFANQGLNAVEIAEMLTLPPEFAAEAHTTGYYGHLVHNVKAVFQRYLSWYDGNPANLWRLPPVDGGRRYVALAGGADALLAAAREAFDAGDYRWVVELVNHLVFADPANAGARELQADAMEQIGYQSESATFRNAFLTGAQELRNGTMPSRPAGRSGYLQAMTIDQIFDSLAVKLKAEEVGGTAVSINFTFPADDSSVEADEQWVLRLSNRTLHAVQGRHDADAAVGFRLTRATLLTMVDGSTSFADAIAAGDVVADGDVAAADLVFGHLDVFMSNFALGGAVSDLRHQVSEWLDANWDPACPRKDWLGLVVDAGYAVPTWPVDWYGLGLTGADAAVVADEFRRRGAPGSRQDVHNLWANTLLTYGTESLKRLLIRRLLVDDVVMCLLYSEPGAGSDLAALQTCADRDGDEFVVTGQKVWTSNAEWAEYGMLVARTDWDVPKHRGISFLFLPMRQPGIEIRGIKQITGETHFNEVFIDGARAPADHLLGPLNEGWRVLQTALVYERSVMGDVARGPRRPTDGADAPAAGGSGAEVDLGALARSVGRAHEPVLRQAIARVHTLRTVNRWNNLRVKAQLQQGSSSPILSLGKLAMSRILHDGAFVQGMIVGADALLDGPDNPRGDAANFLALNAYFTSIGGGTDQIQRNIIGERVLGLPREPEIDRDVPFRDVKKATVTR